MAKVTVNFSDDSGPKEFDLLAVGDYPACVYEIELKDGKVAQYLNWTFKLTPDAGDSAGRQLWNNTSLSAKAAWRLKSDLDALGVEYSVDKKSGAAEFDTDDVIGLNCVLRVGQETYNGQMKNRVVKVLPAGTAPAKKASRI